MPWSWRPLKNFNPSFQSQSSYYGTPILNSLIYLWTVKSETVISKISKSTKHICSPDITTFSLHLSDLASLSTILDWEKIAIAYQNLYVAYICNLIG